MSRRKVGLTKQQDAYVERIIRSGEYRNVSEVFRNALLALQERRRADAQKLKVLRARIDAGLSERERGDFFEFDDAELPLEPSMEPNKGVP